MESNPLPSCQLPYTFPKIATTELGVAVTVSVQRAAAKYGTLATSWLLSKLQSFRYSKYASRLISKLPRRLTVVGAGRSSYVGSQIPAPWRFMVRSSAGHIFNRGSEQ